MTKKKTSINIDEALWKDWNIFVVKKYGTSRKVSDELATALKEHMKNK
jgi:hypothetical protein